MVYILLLLHHVRLFFVFFASMSFSYSLLHISSSARGLFAGTHLEFLFFRSISFCVCRGFSLSALYIKHRAREGLGEKV